VTSSADLAAVLSKEHQAGSIVRCRSSIAPTIGRTGTGLDVKEE
jgi:hypothetical protein